MTIAGLLLAAGRSSRFGGDKLLAPLQGRRVIRWSAEALAHSASPIYVVAPPGAHELIRQLGGLNVVLIEHVGRDEGMGSSIRAGVEALSAEVNAVIIALADQPLVDREVVRQLGDTWRRTQAPAVTPTYLDGSGHPVLFDRSCFAALGELRGDVGARGVLTALGDRVVHVEVNEPCPVDVDGPDALATVERQLAARRRNET